MREADFRIWLGAGGTKGQAGRNSSVSAIKALEKNLARLGSPHPDLGFAHEADGFAQLRDRIGNMRQDAIAGGSDYQILIPKSEKPLYRLSNLQLAGAKWPFYRGDGSFGRGRHD